MGHRINHGIMGAITLAVFGGFCSISHAISFSEITNWTGTGTNRAAMVIDWSMPEVFNNTTVPGPAKEVVLAWGYRFNGPANGQQMLDAILAADSRLYAAVGFGGTFVEGIGYDFNKNGAIGLTDGTTTFGRSSFVQGLLNTDLPANKAYNADAFHTSDTGDVYWGGYNGPNWETWNETNNAGGFVNEPDRGASKYWTPDDPANPYSGHQGQWDYAGAGLSGINLMDGSWLGFTVARGGDNYLDDTDPGTIAFNNDKQAPASAIAADAVPEPATLAVITMGAVVALGRGRRSKTARYGLTNASVAAGLCAGIVMLPQVVKAAYTYNAADFATAVISATVPVSSSPYSDPNAVLGQPPLVFNNSTTLVQSRRAKIVEAPINYDLSGNPVLTQLPNYPNTTQVTVQMGAPITHSVSHPYGDDLIVFGNSFYLSNGSVTDNTNLNSLFLSGTIYSHPVQVSVSPDNLHWFNFPITSGLQPYNAFKWDSANAVWTNEELNPTVPLDPTVYTANFANDSAAQALAAYGESAGGTAFNLMDALDASGNTIFQEGYTAIDYVQVASTGSGYAVISGISAVSPSTPTATATWIPEPCNLTAAAGGLVLLRRARA